MKLLARSCLLGVACTISWLGCGKAETETGEKVFVQPDKSRQGPPNAVVGGFSVTVPVTRLEAGEEAFPCFIAPLELEGPSRVVGGANVVVGPGMHHGNITARPKTGEGFRPCPDEGDTISGEATDVLNGGAVLFGSTTQLVGTEWRTFPDGMGFPIDEDWEIVFRLHYLNASPSPVDVAPKYEWLTIDESTVTTLLGPFIWRIGEFKIPPHANLEVEASCYTPQPMNIVSAMPHMHKLGTRFAASFMGGALDGQLFLDSPGFNPDGLIYAYEPALAVQDVDGFRFSCTWENTFDKDIVEGVGDNEMCMLFGYAYPYEQAYSAIANDLSCLLIPPPLPKGWQMPE